MTTRERTKTPGVYRRESAERMHNGRPDVCFDITYKAGGKKVWEKTGWLSEGYNERLAGQIRAERLRSIRHGEELPKQKAKAPRFADAWARYAKWAETNKARGGRDDVSLYRNCIEARLADKRLDEISAFDLERVKHDLAKEGRAPATVKHVLVLIRQIYNKAAAWGMHKGGNPVKAVKMPAVQNQKTRFLSHQEAAVLLEALAAMQTPTLHDMALLSLQTGMRAGEIFNLRGYDLDFENDLIRISDPKNKSTRHAYMTAAVKAMLRRRMLKNPGDLVFPDRNGKKMQGISQRFRLIVKKLGFNDGITDRRQQITFHSLRHSFASWLALQGESLITIRDLLGHKTTAMTERYSHLISDHKRKAAVRLAAAFDNHELNATPKAAEVEQ